MAPMPPRLVVIPAIERGGPINATRCDEYK
jgi:hypothetical protein